jgi:2-haloacid dehalogenase
MNTYIFDLGNVLIRWDPRNLFCKFFEKNVHKMEWFLTKICTPSWNEKFDAGRPFAEGVRELVNLHPEYADLIRLYAQSWEEMLGDAIEQNVFVLEQLKKRGAPLYALTNWSAETFPIARKRYEFLKLFDGILVSGEEGLIKPDPAIFHLLCERFHLRPQDCFFIDDSEKNILTARNLGMTALHCTISTDLRWLL